jgi:hypothetical protein
VSSLLACCLYHLQISTPQHQFFFLASSLTHPCPHLQVSCAAYLEYLFCAQFPLGYPNSHTRPSIDCRPLQSIASFLLELPLHPTVNIVIVQDGRSRASSTSLEERYVELIDSTLRIISTLLHFFCAIHALEYSRLAARFFCQDPNPFFRRVTKLQMAVVLCDALVKPHSDSLGPNPLCYTSSELHGGLGNPSSISVEREYDIKRSILAHRSFRHVD